MLASLPITSSIIAEMSSRSVFVAIMASHGQHPEIPVRIFNNNVLKHMAKLLALYIWKTVSLIP